MLLVSSVVIVSGCLYIGDKLFSKKTKNKKLANKFSRNKKRKHEIKIQKSLEKTLPPKDSEVVINRNIILSAELMGLTIGGALGYPLLTLFSIPCIVYLQ
ncbi:MAG TPA: hypothetical protein EYP59_15335, partial [Thiotrichaceae bacterium]|nr:hypothetical protein [Thiotrichaceae bacterium]